MKRGIVVVFCALKFYFLIAFPFLYTLHVCSSLWRDLKTPSSNLVEKPFVGYLKVYEVCIS